MRERAISQLPIIETDGVVGSISEARILDILVSDPSASAKPVAEYMEAPFAFSGNIYGAAFFMATGFHGFHVIIGTIFLTVCLLRSRAGHFTPEQHIGFEAAAWYWHFVDVVWLFLFSAVYIWGS